MGFKNLVQTHEQLIDEFKISHEESLQDGAFPDEFTIDFENFEKRIKKKFSMLPKDSSHPLDTNSGVFTLNDNGIEKIYLDSDQVGFYF